MADLLHLVDKPEGWTSHDAVARLRSVRREPHMGHAGTLDPFASGLLLVGEGRAARFLGCLSLLPKGYRARARLGVTTDTQDKTGVPLRTCREIPARAEIERALEPLRGAIRQRPPLYSAVKVRGERLYHAARRGEDVDREERPAFVYELSLIESEPPEIVLDVTVSRGTYVRTLAHDLGERLGCGAHLTSLRRLSSGPFRVEDALSPDRSTGHDAEAFGSRALTPEQALHFLPRVRLDAEESSRLRHGRGPILTAERIERPALGWPLPPGSTGWPVALYERETSLLALARPWEEQVPGVPASLQRVFVAG